VAMRLWRLVSHRKQDANPHYCKQAKRGLSRENDARERILEALRRDPGRMTLMEWCAIQESRMLEKISECAKIWKNTRRSDCGKETTGICLKRKEMKPISKNSHPIHVVPFLRKRPRLNSKTKVYLLCQCRGPLIENHTGETGCCSSPTKTATPTKTPTRWEYIRWEKRVQRNALQLYVCERGHRERFTVNRNRRLSVVSVIIRWATPRR